MNGSRSTAWVELVRATSYSVRMMVLGPRVWPLTVVVLFFVGGCGGSGGAGGTDAGGDAASPHRGAHADGAAEPDGRQPGLDGGAGAIDVSVGAFDALPPFPQVVNSDGGVLTSPTIVAVFFANEDQALLPTFEQFYMGLVSSSYWQALAEYGIGPATVQIKVLTEAAPTTIDDTPDAQGGNTALNNWILAELSSNALPAPTPTTEYVIHFPAGTTVTANGTQCVDFDGYHSDLTNAANTLIAYAVVPRCTDMGSTLMNTFSETASHEVVEAATDPYPDYSQGWGQVDNPHLFWDEANTGSEIGDMCQNDPEAYHAFSDFPFMVQRFWSNTSAAARHDPCVPEIAGGVFFNAVPELPDTGPFNYNGSPVTVASVHIPPGGSKTVYIDAYSDGPLADWDIQALDYNYYFGGASSTALLSFSMPKTRGRDGDRLPVTITVNAVGDPNTNGQVANTELFFIQSSQGTSQTAPTHYWFGLVTN